MATAHAKVILLGEHGVVYGRPALAAAIDRGAQATASPAESYGIELDASAEPVPEEARAALASALSSVLGAYPASPAFQVRASLETPAGAGLGSSASLGVATIRALDEAHQQTRSSADVAALAQRWEGVFHGNPSGIDTTVAATGGVLVYRRGEPPEVIRPRAEVWLVVADSGERAPTRLMVEAVAHLHRRHPDRIEQVFDGMASIVQNGRLAISSGNLSHLGQLMTLNQALLNTLMVSTARLEELIAVARDAGSLGAKLTGGGGGGCLIALSEGPDRAAAVREALVRAGSDAFITRCGGALAS